MNIQFSFLLVSSALLFVGCTQVPSTKDNIRKVIKENRSQFSACYESASKKNPSLNGKLKFGWKIDDRGHVVDLNIISTTTQDEDLDSCMVTTFKSLKFSPAPEGQVTTVEYPFVFSEAKTRK